MARILVAGQPVRAQNYVDALQANGMEAVLSLEPVDDPVSAGFDGLVLPGGSDVDPARYGQENWGCDFIHPDVDNPQFALLDSFVKARLPVLGICKGHQVINVYFGGDLIQDLPEREKARHQHSEAGDSVHATVTHGSSWLTDLYGERFSVNSSHHQAVGKVAPGFQAIQRAEDGVTESIWNESLPMILSIQWHPERMRGRFAREDTVDGTRVFQYFRQLCTR